MVTKPISVSSPAAEGQQEAGSDRAKESPVPQGSSRGHRKQLTVTMAGKKVLYFCSFHILHQSKISPHRHTKAMQEKPRRLCCLYYM